jgi:hypothetical protein
VANPLRIIVTGLIAQHPLLGGVTWDYLQYPLGLARLGHDVYYFEDSGEWPYNIDGIGDDRIATDCAHNVGCLAAVMSRFGLANKWAYRFPLRERWFGLSEERREAVIESADLLINVSGALDRPEDYRKVRRLAYIDTDPVFTQVKLAQGQEKFCRRVNAHDVHFSFGERISEKIPAIGDCWRPTRQPILLSEWHPSTSHREVFTTVMSWTSYEPLTYGREVYAQKDVEMKRFLELPREVRPTVFEVALSRRQHEEWQDTGGTSASLGHPEAKRCLAPRDLLTRAGWLVVDATEVCAGLCSYREYIESSKAEWSVAKSGYVVGRPGWFSCRSACYLAAGRPVVVQETGFGDILPTGEGILPFRDMDEAVAAVREVERNYARHATMARAIAEEYFDSDSVLTRLIEQAMGSSD